MEIEHDIQHRRVDHVLEGEGCLWGTEVWLRCKDPLSVDETRVLVVRLSDGATGLWPPERQVQPVHLKVWGGG